MELSDIVKNAEKSSLAPRDEGAHRLLENNPFTTYELNDSLFSVFANVLHEKSIYNLIDARNEKEVFERFINALSNKIKPQEINDPYKRKEIDDLRVLSLLRHPSDDYWLLSGITVVQFPNGEHNWSINRVKPIGKNKATMFVSSDSDIERIIRENSKNGDRTKIAFVLSCDELLNYYATQFRLPYGESEADAAGALAGKPVEATRAQNGLLVPLSHVTIEGIITDKKIPDGRYCEFDGKTGIPREAYVLEIERILYDTENPVFHIEAARAPPSFNTAVKRHAIAACIYNELPKEAKEKISYISVPYNEGFYGINIFLKEGKKLDVDVIKEYFLRDYGAPKHARDIRLMPQDRRQDKCRIESIGEKAHYLGVWGKRGKRHDYVGSFEVRILDYGGGKSNDKENI
jgi:UbiD family decarboxylase